MAEFDNTNRGAIFKNNRKGDNEKAPDLNGKINWKGEEIEISLWRRTSGKGEQFYSVALKEPYKKDGGTVFTPPKAEGARAKLDDEVPFAPEVR